MTEAVELLDRLQSCGFSMSLDRDELVLSPASKIPPNLLAEVRQRKDEIIQELRQPYGDGQAPPLNRPPKTEQELRRWMDDTANPVNFAKWLERIMNHADPAEEQRE